MESSQVPLREAAATERLAAVELPGLVRNAGGPVCTGDPVLGPGLTHGATGSAGSGTWDKTTADWSNGTADVAWTDGNVAVFAGTPAAGNGTVTIATGISVSPTNLNFTGSGYTISSGAGTGNISTATNQNIGFGATTVTATISALIQGTGSVTVGNSTASWGTLYLTGSNTFTGAVTLTGNGALILGNANALGNGTKALTVPNQTTLGVAGGTTITNPIIANAGNVTFWGTGGGNNTISGCITITNNATWIADSNTALNIQNQTGANTTGWAQTTMVGPGITWARATSRLRIRHWASRPIPVQIN